MERYIDRWKHGWIDNGAQNKLSFKDCPKTLNLRAVNLPAFMPKIPKSRIVFGCAPPAGVLTIAFMLRISGPFMGVFLLLAAGGLVLQGFWMKTA